VSRKIKITAQKPPLENNSTNEDEKSGVFEGLQLCFVCEKEDKGTKR